MLDQPAVYARLAQAESGAVCEVPFGVGDGLGGGVGSQDRRILYYATLHEHPLVGGFIGRMPPNALQDYTQMATVGTLLRLSAEGAAPAVAPETVLPLTKKRGNLDRRRRPCLATARATRVTGAICA